MAYVTLDLVITRNDDSVRSDKDIFEDILSMKISTWMRLYANLETPEYRAKMRDVSINIAESLTTHPVLIKEHGTFTSKFTSSFPYHYFLSDINTEDTRNQIYSVTFHEIIDYTLGEIVDSLHLTTKLELSWIATEYMLAAQNPKMTIFCQKCIDPHIYHDLPFDIDFIEVDSDSWKNHHSKISIVKYSDNRIRIIIFSVSLTRSDWNEFSHGFWVSPILPPLPHNANPSDGESVTNFKKDFIEYLRAYDKAEFFGWESLVHRSDCSAVNVVFIASVPGYHEGPDLDTWGQRKIGKVLSNLVSMPPDSQNWPLIVQSSDIGVFGSSYESWLLKNVVLPMTKERNKKIIFLPDFKLIYPSQKNFNKTNNSKIDSLPSHMDETYMNQHWIKDYLYQWKSEKTSQTLTMPRSQTYTRLSPDATEISWFLLTSASLCKAAWGRMKKNDTCILLKSYNAGVLFIPEIIINILTWMY